jgi:hypothetical protein
MVQNPISALFKFLTFRIALSGISRTCVYLLSALSRNTNTAHARLLITVFSSEQRDHYAGPR